MRSEKFEWTSSDVKAWKDFLTTQTGERLIAKLISDKPTLFPGGETNAILIRSGEARQYDEILATFADLANGLLERPENTRNLDTYPALDDDPAWGDGKTLNQQD
jgi:hypothetical protein